MQSEDLAAVDSSVASGRQPVHSATWENVLAVQDIAGCAAYLGSESEYLACIRAMLDRSIPTARELGRTICNGPDAYTAYVRVLGETILRMPPARVIRFIGDMQLHCDRYQETPIQVDALGWAASLNSEWADSVHRETTSVTVFDTATSEGGVQALQFFAGSGNDRIRAMLEDGGRGQLGGSGAQILRAVTITLTTQRDPAQKLIYVQSLLQSPNLVTGEMLGCQIAHQLASSSSWPEGNCEPALAMLCDALEDPRIRVEVAAQLARGENSEIPAHARALWDQVVELRDRVLATHRGLPATSRK